MLKDDDEEFEQHSSSKDDNETEADDGALGVVIKPPATRFTLEVDALTKMIYKLSECPGCNGPVDIEIKATCVASHVKAACLNVECGCIFHSNPHAPMTMHKKSKLALV